MNLWRDNAACREIAPRIWGAIERSIEEVLASYAGRTRRKKAYSTAVSALIICADCPVRQTCQDWGQSDKYTGIAGGRVMTNGNILTPPK